MIIGAVGCPDCGELVSRDIKIDRDGFPFWACPKCGVVHEDRTWYRYIGRKEANQIIEMRKPLGLFVLDTGIEIIGIDNSTGDAWTEEFPDMQECLLWLTREVSGWSR